MNKKRLLAHLGIVASAAGRWIKAEDEGKPSSAAGDNEILLYGPLVSDSEVSFYREWLGDDSVVSGSMFRERLNALTGDVVLRINCPGGCVHEASTIVNAIIERRNGGDAVDAIVDGMAASGGGVVMVACEQVTISPMGSVMIHKAWGFQVGNADDFRSMAELLDIKDKQMTNLYSKRMNVSDDKILDMMAKEQWFGAEEALAVGLVDAVSELETKKEDDKKMKAAFDRRNSLLAAVAAA